MFSKAAPVVFHSGAGVLTGSKWRLPCLDSCTNTWRNFFESLNFVSINKSKEEQTYAIEWELYAVQQISLFVTTTNALYMLGFCEERLQINIKESGGNSSHCVCGELSLLFSLDFSIIAVRLVGNIHMTYVVFSLYSRPFLVLYPVLTKILVSVYNCLKTL